VTKSNFKNKVFDVTSVTS